MALSLAERLAAAEAAYHDLSIGKAVVSVRDSNGETVEFNRGNRAQLRTYINELKAESGGVTASRAPLRPVFGL